MEYLVNNWPIIVAALAMVVVAVASIFNFSQKPSDEQIKALKEWLLYAVTQAEKELGTGTGKLKLRSVYDKFVATFPSLVKFIKFDDFSDYVDEALAKMKDLIGSNEKIKQYVTSIDESNEALKVTSSAKEKVTVG